MWRLVGSSKCLCMSCAKTVLSVKKVHLVLRGEPNQPNLGLRKRMWGVYTYTLYIRSTGQDYRTIQQDE